MICALSPRRGGPSALFAAAPPGFRPSAPHRRPTPKISNREPIRLEIDVTPTKQTPGHHSNREKNACFQFAINAPASNRPSLRAPKNTTRHPAIMFRVASISTLYFLKLTGNSTYTHVSGRARSTAQPSSTATPGCFKLSDSRRKVTEPAAECSKAPRTHPSFLFRLKSTAVVYFLQLTRGF